MKKPRKSDSFFPDETNYIPKIRFFFSYELEDYFILPLAHARQYCIKMSVTRNLTAVVYTKRRLPRRCTRRTRARHNALKARTRNR